MQVRREESQKEDMSGNQLSDNKDFHLENPAL
jgi:hypothetical protein